MSVPFGPFLLLDTLAAGGMGEVWLASPWGLPGNQEDLCIVKRVKSTLTTDDDTVRRFVDESRLGLLLRHPSVCRTLDAGRVDGSDYLAVELVEGIDVRTLVDRVGSTQRVDAEMAQWMVACALDGLAYAHQARHPLTSVPLGVVHRDVSPHNLMAAHDGVVRVIDFGLALSSVREARTEQGVVLGKLAYMSPEQARGEPVDTAADIYAAGVVLYELLTGERYWGTMASGEIWRRIGLGTHVPDWFAAADQLAGGVLAYMVAVAPRDRLSAAEARDLLLTNLRNGGGAEAARQRLATLVQAVAAPELERMAQARALARAQAPTWHELPVSTNSLAISEVRAVEALLQARAPELAMKPVTETTLPNWRPVAADGATATARVARVPAPSPSASAPSPSPKRHASVAVALAAVVALAVVVGVVVGASTAMSGVPAPAVADGLVTSSSPSPSPSPSPPPPSSSPSPSPSPSPPPSPLAPTTASSTKKPDLLLLQVQHLAGCQHACGAFFRPIAAKGLAGLTPKQRVDLQTLAANCRRSCP